MSFISARLRNTDAQLGRFQLLSKRELIAAETHSTSSHSPTHGNSRTSDLENAIKFVSNASIEGQILPLQRLWAALDEVGLGCSEKTRTIKAVPASPATKKYHEELEWILVSKAAVQVQGWLLGLILSEMTPVLDDIYYWDGVLCSWRYSALYMVQRIPEKLWHTSRTAFREVQSQMQQTRDRHHGANTGLAYQWQRFYGLVREQVRVRTVTDIQSHLVSPVTMARLDASSRLKGLHKQKEMCAAAIGILANESLVFEIDPTPPGEEEEQSAENWKQTVVESIQLMHACLVVVTQQKLRSIEFEDSVFTVAKTDPQNTDDVLDVTRSLAVMLGDTLHEHSDVYQQNRRAFGRPSRLVRYWIPALILGLSSTTLLRILVARRAEMLTWIRELGQTSVDFWYNWVVDPIKRVIGTIRHDESSEIALMSRESLEGDRTSLERMVVDFAIEHPDTAGGAPLTDAQIEQVRIKVKEGDLTPVLRAYEHDLKRPLARAVTGNLIRELLIQIQKTKVDVEVAMSGIDALLKSQELVFGFVSLTPGVLVCVAVGQWISGFFGGRKGRARGKYQERVFHILRTIDSVLTDAVPVNETGRLRYKDHGLILCEIQDLQSNAEKILPGRTYREFLKDMHCLADIRRGIDNHIRVVERLRWGYWKWIS